MKDKVCIIGSGNWGSAIATIIGPNVLQHSTLFEPTVHMWVYEEMVSLPGVSSASSASSSSVAAEFSSSSLASKSKTTKKQQYKLTDVINTYHENVKYLPNIRLPQNIVATSSIETACHNATLLIFVVPHQFLPKLLSQIDQCRRSNSNAQHSTTNCRAISLIKGIDFDRSATSHRPKLLSHIIQDALQMNCGVLMGANIANEVAQQQHVCESTLACDFHDSKNDRYSSMDVNERTRLLFHNEQWFRVQHTTDIVLTEICGAIKNCIALGAGYLDGLGQQPVNSGSNHSTTGSSSNTKAALLRVGLHEIYQFAKYFYPDTSTTTSRSSSNNSKSCIQYTTLMESCGIADLITTCYSGRNRLCAEVFAKERNAILSSKTKKQYDTCQQHWEDIEQRILNGQKIQGVSTIHDVYHILLQQQGTHPKTTTTTTGNSNGRSNSDAIDSGTILQHFPLLSTIYKITFGIEPVSTIVNGIRIVPMNECGTITTTDKRTASHYHHLHEQHQRSFL